MRNNVRAMILFAGTASIIAGCSTTTPLGNNAQMTTSPTGNEVKITQSDGTNTVITSGGGQYPSTASLAQYPGSTVTVCQVSSAPAAGQPKANIILSSKDPVEKVIEFYKGELTTKGWQSDQALITSGTSAITAKKGTGQVTVTATGSPAEGTTISVIEN